MDRATNILRRFDGLLAAVQDLVPAHHRLGEMLSELVKAAVAVRALAETSSDRSSSGAPGEARISLGSQWIVDWIEQGVDGLNEVEVQRATLTRAEIDQRFGARQAAFDLYMDEAREFVLVRPRDRPDDALGPIPWSALDGPEGAFLGLLVDRFYTRQRLEYKLVAHHALAHLDWTPGPYATDSLRTLKKKLNVVLEGLLDRCIISRGRRHYYEVRGQFPYCWIRAADAPSRLLLAQHPE